MNDRPGASFEEREVVDLPLSPPYPEAVFEKLHQLAPRHDAMLDIGCGPGKVSRPLTRCFADVVAVDPSRHMIALGHTLPGGRAPNLHWVRGLAEEAPLDGRRFDLTVAAASIHWMDHDRLFPKLLLHAAPGASRISSSASTRATPGPTRSSVIGQQRSTPNSLSFSLPTPQRAS